MAGFFMLAGTLQSGLDIQQLRAFLQQSGINSVHDEDEDELALDLPATVSVRGGFAHEFILVGDDTEESPLLTAVQTLSQVLSEHAITHEFELYDRHNQLIHELGHPG